MNETTVQSSAKRLTPMPIILSACSKTRGINDHTLNVGSKTSNYHKNSTAKWLHVYVPDMDYDR